MLIFPVDEDTKGAYISGWQITCRPGTKSIVKLSAPSHTSFFWFYFTAHYTGG